MSAVTTVPGFALPKHCPVFDPSALYTELGTKDHFEEHDLDLLGIPHPTYVYFDQDLFDEEVAWLR